MREYHTREEGGRYAGKVLSGPMLAAVTAGAFYMFGEPRDGPAARAHIIERQEAAAKSAVADL
jgi:hypothetical protein